MAVIVDAMRTPRGRGNDKGALKGLKPAALLGQVFRAMAERRPAAPAAVSDAVIGCVTQTADQGGNIGKLAAMEGGWPDTVSAVTINRYCASGLSAVNLAALQADAQDTLALGGGVEMMSRVPMASDKSPLTHDFDYIRRQSLLPIGISADAVATSEGFGREACDTYAAESQRRAGDARAEGRFASLVPVTGEGDAVLLAADETIRPATTPQSLAGMTPAFAEMGAKFGFDAVAQARLGLAGIDHVHHAGNSPATADGASLVLVASEAAAKRAGLAPRARILAMADVAADRTLALTAAVDATRRALDRAGLGVGDIDLFEVNESFAALMLHYMKHLGIGADRLNVNGGAIALGHAMGSTGGALVGTALDELERRRARRACIA
ncbi:MAG: acetyl-CoA C-acyltransferase, partial [Rhodospirillaceae bacterium]|nr:acetyl-CoA C-acyltransferase [Rhodospirillaceae bacterium]